MAKAVITAKSPGKTRSLKSIDYGIIKLGKKGYPQTIRINEVLPFRISFTNIMVPGYSSSDVPPIGIAIVGVNNYIL
jgi:hypothetical protein